MKSDDDWEQNDMRSFMYLQNSFRAILDQATILITAIFTHKLLTLVVAVAKHKLFFN